MGLEDYRVILRRKPRKGIFPDDAANSPSATGAAEGVDATAEICRYLESVGFTALPAPRQIGPARLSAPPGEEIRLSARQKLPRAQDVNGSESEYIVEALIRGRRDQKRGRLLFESLSMRFAVCQPEGAAWHFLKLVKKMCDKLALEVVHGEKTYSPEVFWAFRLRANEQIRDQRARWAELFDGDEDDPAIAVEETWGHFLKRHAKLMSAGVRVGGRHSGASKGAEPTDMEETLPPTSSKPVSLRRTSESSKD